MRLCTSEVAYVAYLTKADSVASNVPDFVARFCEKHAADDAEKDTSNRSVRFEGQTGQGREEGRSDEEDE